MDERTNETYESLRVNGRSTNTQGGRLHRMVQSIGIPMQAVACGVVRGQWRAHVDAVEMRLEAAREPPGAMIGQCTIVVE